MVVNTRALQNRIDELIENSVFSEPEARILAFKEDGYSVIKIKAGGDFGTHLNDDIRRIEKVRKAIGDDLQLAVELNQVLSVSEACIPGKHEAWHTGTLIKQIMHNVKMSNPYSY